MAHLHGIGDTCGGLHHVQAYEDEDGCGITLITCLFRDKSLDLSAPFGWRADSNYFNCELHPDGQTLSRIQASSLPYPPPPISPFPYLPPPISRPPTTVPRPDIKDQTKPVPQPYMRYALATLLIWKTRLGTLDTGYPVSKTRLDTPDISDQTKPACEAHSRYNLSRSP